MINEVAVLGTTFLMMAVHTVWYSSMLFGKQWAQASVISPEKSVNTPLQLLVTFTAFFIILCILAFGIALSPLLPLSSGMLSLGAFVFAAALSAVPAVWENRSRMYYFINLGFLAVLIVGGTYIIGNWPW